MIIGIDVGSTTSKVVLADHHNMEILWSDYQRHEGQQAQKLIEQLQLLEQRYPLVLHQDTPSFITGSGGGALAEIIGARFIQEVNALTLAVEHLYPQVKSVIELGGQDAKIILFKGEVGTTERQTITSMNDKCASGTGATLDKCILKVGLELEDIATIPYLPNKLHPVAAKCGVFAETDIINLLKAGVPADEIINSLADAIVMQNLSILTRGNTLQPKVLLLGGPNTYLSLLQQCWRRRIAQLWQERQINIPESQMHSMVMVPENSQFFAAYGAILFGNQESSTPNHYRGSSALLSYLQSGGNRQQRSRLHRGLSHSTQELSQFKAEYHTPDFVSPKFHLGEQVNAYIGIDGGSTSSKAVLMNEQGQMIAKSYLLSKGNPLEDTKYLLTDLQQQITAHGAQLTIMGCGVTGYAGDVLQKALSTDINVVETVAHLRSAQHYCGSDIDVICDIGGQDVKVLFMKHGEIDHFKLSNQCSAGNGMLLQTLAKQFGVPLTQFADVAFSAESAPEFGYGCAVFLDSDRVNFQKEGYRKEEIFAGMCQVLPKNVWQYVVQIPRLEQFGRKFVLQGGTQYNLAAVKAQVDYIKSRIPDAEVLVHPHTGECGAIGAALEAQKIVKQQGHSRFIGINQVAQLHYQTQTGEETRCEFCDNFCPRTFIDIKTPIRPQPVRHITGFACEKGTVESKQQLLTLTQHRRILKREYPNLVDYESRLLFKHLQLIKSAPTQSAHWMDRLLPSKISNKACLDKRRKLRIGIPRVLNIYSIAPFMRAYLEALGVKPKNIQFSDQTSERLWDEGSSRGAIDPCFPAKVTQAHLHNLLNKHHQSKPLDLIWFPSITHLPPISSTRRGNSSCPVVAGTPSVVKAAFTHESDEFAQHGVRYINDLMNLEDKVILTQQLMDSFGELMGLSKQENRWAIEQGFAAMTHIDKELQQRAEMILLNAKREQQIVLLLLGRPYHSDPGLNHEILEEFQALGYPILSVRSLPRRTVFLRPLFEDEIQRGTIADALDINNLWPENYSSNSSQKVWAAKFAACYSNMAIIDLSSFKCGHDAPTYGLIENIVNSSHTPYFALHDIDANKPSGSINIRIRTFAHNLELYRQTLKQHAQTEHEISKQVFIKRQQLMQSSPDNAKEFNDDLEREQRKIIKRIATLTSDKPQQNLRKYEHTKH